MNEGIAIYLDIDPRDAYGNEKLIRKMDDYLLQYEVKYSGFMNYYMPIKTADRDDCVAKAVKGLRECDWLKDVLAHVLISTRVDVCQLKEIQVNHMTAPSASKFEYYENYFLETKKLAHDILVDENHEIKDGYISYLLAQKYNCKVAIMDVVSTQPYYKLVYGRHVHKCDIGFRLGTEKYYSWRYTLNDPVVPGDVLLVSTRKGNAYMKVEKIEYVTGSIFCEKYEKVKKHLHIRLK